MYGHVGDEITTVKGEELVPIFYKADRYICKNTGTFWLSETPLAKGSKGWDSANPRRATWIILEEKASGLCFHIINTHLDHQGQRARIESVGLIKEISKEWTDDNPIILCGDMNFTSISQPYYNTLNQSYMMFDAYHISERREGVNYTFHRFGKNQIENRHIVDYIFVTNKVLVKSIIIPEEKKANGVYMSDHNPVIATFELY